MCSHFCRESWRGHFERLRERVAIWCGSVAVCDREKARKRCGCAVEIDTRAILPSYQPPMGSGKQKSHDMTLVISNHWCYSLCIIILIHNR